MRLAALSIVLIVSTTAFSQGQADWWYFGQNAGVHFEASGPVADTNGKLSTIEGCASISTPQGDLLFYTDGITVWNAQHDTMPNGEGLFGDPSSSQSGIIVPRPGNPDHYYIFSTDAYTFNKLPATYSLVDMTLDGGLGDVVVAEKNVTVIAQNAGENLTAVQQANGIDYWVVFHKQFSDTVLAFEVTSAGVNLTPVVSATGVYLDTRYGGSKASPDGSKIAVCSLQSNEIKLMQFDPATGLVGTTFSWTGLFNASPYGVEFSPNSERLFVSDGWQFNASRNLTQYDVSLFDSLTIVSSEFLVEDSVSDGQVQLGPDGRIYLSYSNDTFLHRINAPNELGALVDFEEDAVFLEGRLARRGLPPFVQSIFNVSFEVTGFCATDTTFFLLDTTGVDSVFWTFGDSASGVNDTSTSLFPFHIYTDSGSYSVTVIATSDSVVDTTTQQIFIYPIAEFDFGPADTFICQSDTLAWDVSQAYATYLWHDSNTTAFDTAFSTGTYSITVDGFCNTVTDSIFVRVDSTISFTLGPDTQLCVGQVLELDAELTQPAIIEWTGLPTTVDSIFVNTSGTYEMSARNGCGTTIDDITVTFIPVPFAALPPDTINCFDAEIILTRPDVDSLNFVWSDSTTGIAYTVDSTETVWLASFSDCGFAIDTINIVFNGEIYTELGEDTAICDEDSLLLNAFHPGATYQWSTNEQTDTLWATEDRLYRVTITAGSCQKVESIDVELQNALCPEIDCELRFPNVLTANADGVNDVFRVESDCKFQEFTLRIYNRWGMLVHQSDNENIGWDGYVLGELAPTGTYFFTIDYKHNVVVAADFLDYRGSFTVLH